MSEGNKGQRPNAGDPQSCHEVNPCLPVPVCNTRKHVPGLFRPNLLQVPVFLVPRWFTVFGGWVLLPSILVLYGTYRAHDERMKSAVSAERAY